MPNMRVAAFFLLLLLSSTPALTQTVSFGLSAGVPINDSMTAGNGHAASTGRYTFGPALRLGHWHGFGFHAELLYKSFGFGFASDSARARVHRLEIPLLVEYAGSRLPAHPFVRAGIAFNRVLAVSGANVCGRGKFGEEVFCMAGSPIAELRHRHTHGPVLGIGCDLELGRLGLSPELRFTRWVDRNFGTRDSSLRSNLSQLEIQFGLAF